MSENSTKANAESTTKYVLVGSADIRAHNLQQNTVFDQPPGIIQFLESVLFNGYAFRAEANDTAITDTNALLTSVID